jgi:hypothetical protein
MAHVMVQNNPRLEKSLVKKKLQDTGPGEKTQTSNAETSFEKELQAS